MRRICAENRVVYYCSDIIPCIHGFSTRIGGISSCTHTKGLNLAFGRGDDRETVLENLRLFSAALGIEPEGVISVSQVHSDNIRFVGEDNRGEGYYREELEHCDGYVTDENNITLGIKTADCVPILLYAPTNGTFGGGVAAVHAGWRGTALGIVKKAVHRLCDMGAVPSEIKVAIGPSIGSCCYLVREDFYKSFCSIAGRELTELFVLPVGDGQWTADLKGVNIKMLCDSGILRENIDACALCTCCHCEEFYSHRFSNGKRGTMLSVITKETQKRSNKWNF